MASCNVVRDLIPLCLDGVASEESKKLVAGHAAGCAECAKLMETMGADLELPISSQGQAEDAKPLEKASKAMTLRFAKIAVAVAVVAVVLIGGIVSLNRIMLPVDPNDITFSVEEGRLLMTYEGEGDILFGACGAVFCPDVDSNDDSVSDPSSKADSVAAEEGKAEDWSVEFSQTVWDRYIDPIYDKRPHVYSFANADDVAHVYGADGKLLWSNPNSK